MRKPAPPEGAPFYSPISGRSTFRRSFLFDIQNYDGDSLEPRRCPETSGFSHTGGHSMNRENFNERCKDAEHILDVKRAIDHATYVLSQLESYITYQPCATSFVQISVGPGGNQLYLNLGPERKKRALEFLLALWKDQARETEKIVEKL
jgi:hypothetical protein